jgi:hypothetical protein
MKEPRPANLWPYAIGAVALAAIVLIAVWLMRRPSDHISPEDVEAMEVYLRNRPDHGPDLSFIPARADYGQLPAIVQHGEADPKPAKWATLGRLSILLSNGDRVVQIDLYQTSNGPAAWSVGGRYYRGSTNADIIRVISDCATRGASIPENEF